MIEIVQDIGFDIVRKMLEFGVIDVTRLVDIVLGNLRCTAERNKS